jgi:outer membrane protein assembly factor BamB
MNGVDHSNYQSAATSITPTNIGDLQPVWRWLVPSPPNGEVNYPTKIYSSPSAVDGIMYVGSDDGYFYAVDTSTQAIVWSKFLGVDKGTTCGNAGIVSTAAVVTDPVSDNLTVYVNAPDGYLYALDASSGATVWKSVVAIPYSTTKNTYYPWSSPTVANGKIYVGIASQCSDPQVPGGLKAFNQRTGAQVGFWHTVKPNKSGGSIWSSASVLPNGQVVATTGNGIAVDGVQPDWVESIVRYGGGLLRQLDAWQIPEAQHGADSDFGGSPTQFIGTVNGVPTSLVGACNKNGVFYAMNEMHLAAGPVWSYQVSAAYAGAAAECDAAAVWDGTNLLVSGGAPTTIGTTTYQGSIRSLDPSTGAPIWQDGLNGTIVGSPTEDGAGLVAAPVFQSTTGNEGVYLIEASTGDIVGFIPVTGSQIFAQPVFTGDQLLVAGGPDVGVTAYQITTPGPAITKVSPSTVVQGTTKILVLRGTDLAGSLTTFLSDTGVTVLSTKVKSPTELWVKVNVESAAIPAAHNISVISPGSPPTADTCTACLTVTASEG